MNYEETLKYIHSLGKFTYPATLSRISEALDKLNNPQDNFLSFHIAGTNGKGSTALFISEIMRESGHKTGLFISPYVVNFRERMQINGEYIKEKEVCIYAEKVIKTEVKLNEFEFITAMCFLWFFDKKVDVAVVEVGLGGRLDATNALKNVCCSVICKIGLDHTKILGDTVERIAEEKCGIIKGNIPVVTIPSQDKSALAVIKKHTNNLFIPKKPEDIISTFQENSFIYKGKRMSLKMLGKHQCYNAITAISAVENSGVYYDESKIPIALKNASFPSRLEIIDRNPVTVLDGAHNVDAADVLCDFLKKADNVTAVIAMMHDKDTDEFLSKTLKFVKAAVITEIDYERCEKAEILGNIAKKYNKNIIIEKNLENAIKKAKENAIKTGGSVFIFGSLYLSGEVYRLYPTKRQ